MGLTFLALISYIIYLVTGHENFIIGGFLFTFVSIAMSLQDVKEYLKKEGKN